MSENKINGIVCNVEKCKYHAMDDTCVAGSIKVSCYDSNNCKCDNVHYCKTYTEKN